MVDLCMLTPGMKVKIVDQWVDGCCQSNTGEMDKFLGRIVTICNVYGIYATINEDEGDCSFRTDGHWSWNKHCFDCIIDECEDKPMETASEQEIYAMIFGS